jgi:hypothetical protein
LHDEIAGEKSKSFFCGEAKALYLSLLFSTDARGVGRLKKGQREILDVHIEMLEAKRIQIFVLRKSEGVSSFSVVLNRENVA